MESVEHIGAEYQLSMLERLPIHVLSLICDFLAHRDRKRRNLLAFAQTSRTCHTAADVERFRYIQVDVNFPNQDQLHRLREVLSIGFRRNFVRVLTFRGTRDFNEEEKDRRSRLPSIRVKMEGWDDEDEALQDLCDPVDDAVIYRPPWRPIPQESTKRYEEAWASYVEFFEELPRIKDVVYAPVMPFLFPRTLLSAIQNRHPLCRLHVPVFLLRSVIYEELEPRPMDPDEVALATSPCLYSLVLNTSDYSEDRIIDYNHEAVLSMLRGSAPNLKSVIIRREWTIVPGSITAREKWRGFPVEGRKGNIKRTQKGRIQSLSIDRMPATAEFLSKWSEHLDFSGMGSLEIKGTVGLDILLHLVGQAVNGRLDALCSLSLLDLGEIAYRGDISGATRELLRSLRDLKKLELNHSLVNREVVATVMEHHAKSLWKLTLLPQYQKRIDWKNFLTEIPQEISRECLELRELDIMVPRLKKEGQETEAYRSLRSLPRLEHLTLRLECAARTSNKVLKTAVAVPRLSVTTHKLVESIFKDGPLSPKLIYFLSRNNSGLHTLVVDPFHLPPVYPAAISGLWVRWLGRRWAIRNTGAGSIDVSEVYEQRGKDFGKVLGVVTDDIAWRIRWHLFRNHW